MTTGLFLVHTFTTLAMTGVIWFVQLVHYPLFEKVGSDHFVAYEKAHMHRTGMLVMPLMFGELLTGILLCFLGVQGIFQHLLWIGLGLIGINWLITFLLFVPMHRALSQKFSLSLCRRLVYFNWLRTAVWSLRSILLSWGIYALSQH